MNNEKPDSINIYKKLKKGVAGCISYHWYAIDRDVHWQVHHVEGQSSDAESLISTRFGQSADGHVFITDCLHLSQFKRKKKASAPMKKVNRQPILYIIYIYFLGGIVLFVCVYSHIILCPCKWETLRRCEIFVCRSGERQWGHYHPSPSAKDATAIVFCPYVTAHRLGKR
jgi:hypothetical protein